MRGVRETECLRQERETFDVRKAQSRCWFWLRVATVAVLLLIAMGVFVVSACVILSPDGYPPAMVTGSGIALMVDLLAIGGTSFASVLKPASQPVLAPVTRGDVE